MTKTAIVKVRVTKEEQQRWKALAAQFGQTLSDFLRGAVKDKEGNDGSGSDR